MVTFQVDDVTPATEALPTQPLGEVFADALVLGGDPGRSILVANGVHPLLDAVGRAFADHRPLVLSPDAVWLTIAQGVAQHIRLHPDELRRQLVSHHGRRSLAVTTVGPMPLSAPGWAELVQSFSTLLQREVDDWIGFDCDFSTSTDVDRIAGQVVLLDAYSPYFAYWAKFVCGIPSITLTGTVVDWQKIRARVEWISDLDLRSWCRSLAPIADEFTRAAAGNPDTAFWQRIYSPIDAYGGTRVTGWISRFYPYLTQDGVTDRPNFMLELPIDEPRDVAPDERGFYNGPGISTDSVPATMSQVRVNVNDRFAKHNRVVALKAGLVGVGQDDDGALRPILGWHLTPVEVEIDDVIDRIVRDHAVTEPEPFTPLYAAADVIALYRRLGSAALFDGVWLIRPFTEHRHVTFGHAYQTIVTMIDLSDGRSIGALQSDDDTTHWAMYRTEKVVGSPQRSRNISRLLDDPADVPVYGTSLTLLLDAALDTLGDITHLETGHLAELVDPT